MKKIIGISIFVFLFLSVFGVTVASVGLVNALLMWGASVVFNGFVLLALWLVE